GYFQQDGQWYHDLAKPTDLDKRPYEIAQQTRRAQDDADQRQQVQESARTLMSDPAFARTGKLSEESARAFARTLFQHDRNLAPFIQAVNEELARQNSPARIQADIAFNQPGLHGN